MKFISVVAAICVLSSSAYAQKVGYYSSDAVRAKFDANITAEQRIQTMVDGWKQDLASMQQNIDELELEIKKNRLIWSDSERLAKEKEVEDKKHSRDKFAREKFEPGGEHDREVEKLFKSVGEKIFLAVQKVAAAESYDVVWDKSSQPLVYVNAKYDLTVKVMKELGIDAGDMERKQQDIIENDPRNKKTEEPRRRKSRTTKEETPPVQPIKTVNDTVAQPTLKMVPQPTDSSLKKDSKEIPR